MRKKYIIIVAFLSFFVSSCEKENADKPIYSVYFEMDLRITPYSKLTGRASTFTCPDEYPDGSLHPSVRGAGFIIVHTLEGEYRVIDRTCRNPSCEEKRIPVFMEESQTGFAYCKECKSRYFMLLGFGTVENGPAKKPLRTYPTPAIVTYDNKLRYSYTATY